MELVSHHICVCLCLRERERVAPSLGYTAKGRGTLFFTIFIIFIYFSHFILVAVGIAQYSCGQASERSKRAFSQTVWTETILFTASV
jgi:hypothetical protein